ncbi:MAG: OsmC family protein [Chitinophagales bacterium]|nr:OsmC family protein [Chitinophagales bacterium]
MEHIIQVQSVTGETPYRTEIQAGTHIILADEPEESGGQDLGATPTRYLCSALASCIGITLRMYADRKEWKTGAITVDVELDRSGDKPVFSIGLRFANTLPEDQLQRLQLIAGKCPVHKLLHGNNEFRYV